MIYDIAIPAFIAELRVAAADIDLVTMEERRRLLDRAARTVRDYRYEINLSDAPANDDGPGDIATHWSALAAGIEDVPDTLVANALADAAESIHACKVRLRRKWTSYDAGATAIPNARPAKLNC